MQSEAKMEVYGVVGRIQHRQWFSDSGNSFQSYN